MDVRITLPRPHEGQQQVLDSEARWKVLLCGRRWGKTLIAQIIAIQRMLAGQSIAYVTPTFDLSKSFFNELLKVIPASIITSANKTDLTIQLITGGSLKFFSGESLDRFRGYRFHYAIIDESAFISNLKESWFSSIRPTLSDYEGGALFISTPNGKEFFYSLFIKGQQQEPGYQSFHFSSDTNPYFPKAEFEAAKSQLPEFQFRQEYLAIPAESQSNPIGTDYINANIITTLSTGSTIVYGIDLAKYNDWTVICGIDQQGHMTYFDRFQLSWEQTKDKIKNLPGGILKVIDSTGVGDVLVEQLANTTQNIRGFKFTSESKPKLIYQLIKDIQAGKLKYNQITADELHVFQYSYSSTGHIKFEAMPGFHDDCVIALSLANAHRSEVVAAQSFQLYFV